MRLLALLVAALLLVASEPRELSTPLGSSRIWTSEHFIYESRASDPTVCEGILETLERHRAAVTAFLGIPGPEARIRYMKFRNPWDLHHAGHCSPESAACYFAALGIETHARFEQHELIHAYLAYLGDSHKLLEEGVAEAFSCDTHLPMAESLDWERAFSETAWRQSDIVERRHLYQAGAWFVGYLLRHGSPQQFIELYSLVRPSDEGHEVAALFQSIYEEDLPDVWERALHSPDPTSACIYAYECATPDFRDSPLTSYGEACDASDRFRTIRLSESSLLVEQVKYNAGHLHACPDAPPLPSTERINPVSGVAKGDLLAHLLGPGRYAYAPSEAEVRLEVNPPGSFVIPASVSPETGIPDGPCSALEPVRSQGARELLFAVAADWKTGDDPEFRAGHVGETESVSGSRRWLASWEDPAMGTERRSVVECGSGVTLQICSSCTEADCDTVCDTRVRGEVVRLPAGRIWFRWSAPRDAWFSLRRVTR